MMVMMYRNVLHDAVSYYSVYVTEHCVVFDSDVAATEIKVQLSQRTHESMWGIEVYLHAFLTLALGGSQSYLSGALPLGKNPVPIGYKAGCAPELVWTLQNT
jgi:hypothetical protein